MKESSNNIDSSFIPYQQSTIIAKPSEDAFNNPMIAIMPEFSFNFFVYVVGWNYKTMNNIVLWFVLSKSSGILSGGIHIPGTGADTLWEYERRYWIQPSLSLSC